MAKNSDNELYNEWKKDSDSDKTRSLAEQELEYYVNLKPDRNYDSEQAHPVINYFKQQSKLDSNFADYLRSVYGELCEMKAEAESEINWSLRDWLNWSPDLLDDM